MKALKAMSKKNIPYIVFAGMLLLGLYFYWTKPTPEPQIIYITQTDSSQVYKHKADSLSYIIAGLDKDNAVLKNDLEKQKQQHSKDMLLLATMPPTEQVKHFGRTTGDTTLQMRLQDSLTLVPLPCIIRANVLIAEGQGAKEEAEILSRMNVTLNKMIEHYREAAQSSTEYIAFLEDQKNIAEAEWRQKQKELDRQRQRTKTAGYIGAAGWGLAVLAILL